MNKTFFSTDITSATEYQELFSLISSEYPAISDAQVKICSLVTLGWSNLDIATLLGTNEHAIEEVRHRIRKSMGLPKRANIKTYILRLQYEKIRKKREVA